MKIIKYFFLVFPIIILNLSGQNLEFYPYITNVSVGETIWNEDSEEGQFFRIIITSVEIYQHIYVESLITDSEGYKKEVKYQFKIPLSLFNKLKVNEFGITNWKSHNLVELIADSCKYQLQLSNNLKELKIQSFDNH